MTMSGKHYNGIAYVLKEHSVSEELVSMLCDYFEEDNPNFDRDRFKRACS